jgi:hygromycin-B 4-O-kinase
LRRIEHGEWSKAFSFAHAGAPLIARFSAIDEDFLKDQRVMGYAAPGLPVPEIVDVGSAFGGYYALSKRIEGGFLEDLDAVGFARVLPTLFDALDAMRGVDLRGTAGFGVWGADGNAQHATWRHALLDIAIDRPTDRVYGWRPRLALAPSAERAFAQAYAEVEALVEQCPNERSLVHSDLLYFNVLVDEDRVRGVIDWGSSLYGDFLWDVAWLTFWQPWYTAWRDVDILAAARRRWPVPAFEARHRCYELCIGLDGMKYQAFTSRASDLEWTARRTLEVLGTGR